MISDSELQAYAQSIALATKHDIRGLCCVVLAWPKGQRAAHVQMSGEVEPGRDVPRLLREMADAIERSQGALIRPRG